MDEVIRAVGHGNVTARHASTFEVTTEDYLTPAGDCILGTSADRAPADFAPEYTAACRDRGTTISATIEAAGLTETVTGRGHPDFTFASDTSAVFRTSDYVDDRTVMIDATAAARDLDRALVERLASGAPLSVTVSVA